MVQKIEMQPIGRRDLLKMAGTGAFAALSMSLLPGLARADAAAEGKTITLFVELQGVGYPGSTYELVYDRSNDVLIGIYFQAAMQQRFDVVFVRTK